MVAARAWEVRRERGACTDVLQDTDDKLLMEGAPREKMGHGKGVVNYRIDVELVSQRDGSVK